MRHVLAGFVVFCFLLAGPENAAAASSEVPPKLKRCPSTPNCVSSLAQTPRHKIEPLRMQQSAEKAMLTLKAVIAAYPRTKIITEMQNYIRTEFRVNTGFIDDVEFLIDETAGVVHVRSASRLGYWDFGANRKRIEKIRKLYSKGMSAP
ncbi:MAG TPA: DUF1499 domain-containing protein [Dissulfurispiraceae bacterium]|nr:DUF1499 domain-containing protein [Dissulfurispiraceae bacterium]